MRFLFGFPVKSRQVFSFLGEPQYFFGDVFVYFSQTKLCSLLPKPCIFLRKFLQSQHRDPDTDELNGGDDDDSQFVSKTSNALVM